MAAVYKKSIAEQNSVEVSIDGLSCQCGVRCSPHHVACPFQFAWSLLMRPEYVDLRSAIYSNEKELRRFRQIIVNCVLATG